MSLNVAINLGDVLKWMTGPMTIPVIGLPNIIKISFDKTRCLSYVNTCVTSMVRPITRETKRGLIINF